MSDFDPLAYTFVVQRKLIEEAAFFVGTVTEFPDVEVYEATQARAYGALKEVILDLKELFDSQGREFPGPRQLNGLPSGRITLRVPKALHAKAVAYATSDGISLNQWLLSTIAEGVGVRQSAPEHRSSRPTKFSAAGRNEASKRVEDFTAGRVKLASDTTLAIKRRQRA